MANYTILSTKVLLPSSKEALSGKGIQVVEQPFIDIRPILSPELKETITGYAGKKMTVIFTSQNAYKAVHEHLGPDLMPSIPHDWKVFCLSGATRDAILAGYIQEEQLIGTAPDAAQLAEKILAHGPTGELVFFCGSQRRDTLPDRLRAAGIPFTEVAVYETVAAPVLTTDEFDAALFFSPSAVKSFFSVNSLPKTTACFAIGHTTAETIADYTDNRIITSEAPDQLSMLTGLVFYLQNKDQYP